jgi:hypothetical protein
MINLKRTLEKLCFVVGSKTCQSGKSLNLKLVSLFLFRYSVTGTSSVQGYRTIK